MQLKLQSEFGRIKRVITHRPGPEIDRLTPQNTSELLFEDVPYLESMQKDYAAMQEMIFGRCPSFCARAQDVSPLPVLL